ncbi:MAG: pyridoxal phosphate-dependent decarboxylase family protein [Myxococcota bacterium]
MSDRDLFAIDRFRADAHNVVELMTQYLAQSAAIGSDPPVLPRTGPNALCELFPSAFPEVGDGDLVPTIRRALEHSTALHSPGFVGHQVATPLPGAALCDLVAALTNNGMAIYEMGPAGTAMEKAVLQHLGRSLGMPENAGGVLTSGGSLGNLTALLAARQEKAGFDVWRRGLAAGPQLVVLVAATAHYSVARAVRVLGLGDAGIVDVEVDDRLRLSPEALERAIVTCRKEGKRPIAVVASAGSTAAGAIDPLDEVADICARHDLWFHVDGAHGASLVLSRRRREHLKGIERADSVVWDAHKMLAMPALLTALLFRDGKKGARAFSQSAAYLFHDDDKESWADVGRRTMECTKRAMSLKLYACLEAYGTRFFEEHVDRCCDLATALADAVRAHPSFELLTEPSCNIVCFRLRGLDGGQQAAVRRMVVEGGRFYLVKVRIEGELWLRCTLASPRTTKALLSEMLEELAAAAASLPGRQAHELS